MASDDAPQFSDQDLNRIRAETWVRSIDYRAELSSTNDLALHVGTDRSGQVPALVLADRQLAGRGRGANQWWSAPGALTFSLLVDFDPRQVPPDSLPLVSLASALAVCQTLDPLVADQRPGLKWPNDVYLLGRKICGILIESVPNRGGRFVLGVGINVNNSFQGAPAELRQTGIALCDATSRNHQLPDLLIQALVQLEQVFSWIISDRQRFQGQWKRYCILRGSQVVIQSAERRIAGLCHGIAGDGALLIGNATRPQRVYSGVVIR